MKHAQSRKWDFVPGLNADRELPGRNYTEGDVAELGLQQLEEARHVPKYPSASSQGWLGTSLRLPSFHIQAL